MDTNTCKNCRYWQDYTKRFHARLSFNYNRNMGGGTHELRLCRNEPIPALASAAHMPIYTDEDHSCSGWQPLK